MRDILKIPASIVAMVVYIGLAIIGVEKAKGQTLTLEDKEQVLVCQPLTLWEKLQQSEKQSIIKTDVAPEPLGVVPASVGVGGDITIKPSRTQCYAPCGVHFTAESPNRLFRTFTWDFADKGSVFRSTGKSSNSAIGFHVGHVFGKSGNYEVSVKDGNDVAKVWITVEDYKGKTYCVNCDQGERVSSFEEGLGRIQRARTGRLLLLDNTTHKLDSDTPINRAKDVVIGSTGLATVVIDNPIGSALSFSRSENVTVYGIVFKGNYSPVTGKGSTWSTDGVTTFNVSDLTVYRSSFIGLNKGVFTTSGLNTVIADNFSTNWHDYGVYAQHYDESKDGKLTEFEKGANFIVAGNDFQQNPQAVSGGGGKRGGEPRWADHSSFRQQWSANTGIHQNVFTSTTGWSSDGKGHNPPLRFHQGGDSGFSGSITENQLNGGFVILSAATMNRQTIAGKGELLIEKNTLKASSNTIYGLRLSYSESVVRDNTFLNDQESKSQLLPFHYFVELDYGTLTDDNVKGKKVFSGNVFKLNLPSVPVPFKDFGESYDKTNGEGLKSVIIE
jgi:hypothetical protein